MLPPQSGASTRRISERENFNFSLNNMTGFDLHGKTVGIIGTGRIGRVFMDICRGFGMRIWRMTSILPMTCPMTCSIDMSIPYVTTRRTVPHVRHYLTALPVDRVDLSPHRPCVYGKMKKGVVIESTRHAGALIDAEELLKGSSHAG